MNKTLDVLLINAPSPNPGSILSHRIQGLPPLGICYIATWLNSKGYKAELLDFYIRGVTLRNLDERMNNQQPKIVGISTTTETYKSGLRIARHIKAYYPKVIVVMGGCHVTFEYEEPLRSGYVDYISRGEGEITFEELCDHVLHGKQDIRQIDGLSYMEGDQLICNKDRAFICDLDRLPYPDRSLFDIEKYSYPASISTSRGCPGRCIFCAATALSGGKYRMRSPESVVGEIEYLIGMGHKHIQFIDDTMTASIRRLNRIIELIMEKNLNITWACESRVDIIDKPLLQRLKAAGCKALQFGVEAGNQEMLDSLKKNITLEQIHQVFNWCSEVGIAAASCLIIGQPFDTPETIDQTIAIGLELQNRGAQIVFSISTPYPGTYMYNHTDELGLEIINKDTDYYTTQTPVYHSKNLKAYEIQNRFFDACVKLAKNNKSQLISAKYKKVMDEAMKVSV